VLSPVRRVVTGHDSTGRSVIQFDGPVSPSPQLPTDVASWVTNKSPASNAGRADPIAGTASLEPPANGSVFRFVMFPPSSALAGMSADEIERLMAGLFEQLGATHTRVDTKRGPGMHKTKTTDYIIVLSGEITLMLDDGEVDLKPFDVIVQRGTNHAWVNRGSTPALLAAILIDAAPV
jgi:quercetin dioxygenase-like cupin family protein